MVTFPNAKINLGLQVAFKRSDGYHNLRSVIYPVSLFDVLELKRASAFELKVWNDSSADTYNNLIVKVWQLLNRRYGIPPVEVHLLKNIPVRSGLGGASADALFFMKECLKHFNVAVTRKALLEMAALLCSDCPFFVHNRPAYVIGRGNVVEPLSFNLTTYTLLLLVPNERISTGQAFAKIKSQAPQYNLKQTVLEKDFKRWRQLLRNDFETLLPRKILRFKDYLYEAGALYASLTGSGSGFYGIFEKKPGISPPENSKMYHLNFI